MPAGATSRLPRGSDNDFPFVCCPGSSQSLFFKMLNRQEGQWSTVSMLFG